MTAIHCPSEFVLLEEDRPHTGGRLRFKERNTTAREKSNEHHGGVDGVADEESQWASERMGLPEGIRVVHVQVGRERAAITPVLAARTK